MQAVPLLLAAALLSPAQTPAQARLPIKLYPENPHYFLFRGLPAILITSGEHYGAVLNLDFDFAPYLDELRTRGFNLTRTFSGTYREIPGSFAIRGNTLAPAPTRYAAPWARSTTPGYHDGGNKFDLSKWDEDYWKRLSDFVSAASERGIVVEYVLFCPMYEDVLWKACPMNAVNNVNGVGNVPSRESVYTLDHPDLLDVQTAFVRKAVAELARFDNVYYEICNEPYFGGVTLEWQRRIADTIVDAEKSFPEKHLIAQNISNGSKKIEDPHPAVSVFNFHYASPPDAVAQNYGLGKAIGFDESGFRGPRDAPYRTEAWDFILAGGALYSNLDYSFTPEREDGSADPDAPGGGGPALREQLKVLKDFIHGFDFVKMAPDPGLVSGSLPGGISARALSEAGKAHAVYLRRRIDGPFAARWTGKIVPAATGACTFHTLTDDGVRLWVDGKLLIDDWKDNAPREHSGAVELREGMKAEIRLEYYEAGGGGVTKLSWSSAGRGPEVVPPDRLEPTGGEGRGLLAEYFADRDMKTPVLTRTDSSIDFDWKSRTPFETETESPVALELQLPAGSYRAEWVSTLNGKAEARNFEHGGGPLKLESPPFREDISLRILKS